MDGRFLPSEEWHPGPKRIHPTGDINEDVRSRIDESPCTSSSGSEIEPPISDEAEEVAELRRQVHELTWLLKNMTSRYERLAFLRGIPYNVINGVPIHCI